MNKQQKTLHFYYLNNDGTITRLNETTNKIDTLPIKDKKNYYYEMFKGFDKTHEDLVNFKNNFLRCNEELKRKDEVLDFTKYYSNHGAVERIFNWYANFELKKLDLLGIQDVTFVEFSYGNKCYNVGIMYFDKQFKDKPTMCYGYDFRSFYIQFLNKMKLCLLILQNK